MANNKILVIGSVNVDYVLDLPSFPAPGETAVGSNFRIAMGGKGANQAVACARLSGATQFLACVGDDTAGSDALTAFSADGIDIDAITVSPQTRTGAALIFVNAQGENCIGISAEANAHLSTDVIRHNEPLIAAADFLLLQLETPLATVSLAAEIASRNQTIVILNPAPVESLLPAELLNYVDIITPNQTEAEALTGVPVNSADDAWKAATVLHEYGIATVIVTLGAKGAAISDRSGFRVLPAANVKPVDTVAAGDTFNGALVVGLSESMNIDEAVEFANAAAGISVSKAGAQPSIPHRAKLSTPNSVEN